MHFAVFMMYFISLYRHQHAAETCWWEYCEMKFVIRIEAHFVGHLYTVELHLPGRWLSGSSVTRIGLALLICREFYKTNLP